MKDMKNKENLTDRDWQELAGFMSEETGIKSEKLKRFMAEDSYETERKWKELKYMKNNEQINVDQAWDKVVSKINETENNIIQVKRYDPLCSRYWSNRQNIQTLALGNGIITRKPDSAAPLR